MPQRHQMRLPQYDYASAGAYFVTICAHERRHLFGEIIEGEMRLNEYGRVIDEECKNVSSVRHEIELDEWVIMPNHFHAIVFIVGAHGDAPSGVDRPDPNRADRPDPKRAHHHAPLRRIPKSISTYVNGFKWATTSKINILRQTSGIPIWQRNYYEHVIRDDRDLARIRQYILENPMKWAFDVENVGDVNNG